MATPTLEQWRLVQDYLETDNWKSLLQCSLPIPILSPFFEPRHQFVRYDATIDRVSFHGCGDNIPFCRIHPPSPSDCIWFVPGQEV